MEIQANVYNNLKVQMRKAFSLLIKLLSSKGSHVIIVYWYSRLPQISRQSMLFIPNQSTPSYSLHKTFL